MPTGKEEDEAFKKDPHVLIIGAGIMGAILAHALREASIPFTLYERDAHIATRGQGWGISFHWALPTLLSLLPAHLHALIDEASIFSGPRDQPIVCVDAGTLQERYTIPPQRRLLVRREQLRQQLLKDLPVAWGKKLVGMEETPNGMRARFSDGTTATGSFLVGADGGASVVRGLLMPEAGKSTVLPVSGVGFSVVLSEAQVRPLLAVGTQWMAVSETGTYLWFSVLEVPTTSGEDYTIQVQLSWPRRSAMDDVPPENEARVGMVKSRVDGFAPELRDAIRCVTAERKVAELRMADWPRCEWPNLAGRVALVGDAAHAMTMFRGEAANHGVADVAALVEGLKKALAGEVGMREMLGTYESELKDRCRPAVLASRQACLDAHRWELVRNGSPLLTRGLVTAEARL